MINHSIQQKAGYLLRAGLEAERRISSCKWYPGINQVAACGTAEALHSSFFLFFITHKV